ncbi:MAG TPA: glycosyltransferase family 2 protein [Thermoanaerobaculia bacterium]|nr:glycosyltransferase family 2 protein [Thermoanaerobaculia bacterium]
MPSVDVVIVTWNGRDDTLRAVDAVFGQTVPPRISKLTVTVVDNGSTDGTLEELAARFPQTRTLKLWRNRGFTGGVRLGVTTSDADYVVLLNNDAIPEPEWLREIVEAIDMAPPDVLAVGGEIVDSTGTLVDFARGAMTFDGHAFQIGVRKKRDEVDVPPPGSEILFPCGGNMIARREAFLAAGGFDDDYFAYLEDVDFGWRSWIAGQRILWEPRARVRHRSAATSDRLGSFERGVLFERNALQTAIKNYEDGLMQKAAASVFLTALHRMHRYTVDRNEAARLRRPPLDEAPIERPPASGLVARALRKLGLRSGAAPTRLDDELTAMQFRALEWFFRNEPKVMTKRAAVQAMRRRSDTEILEKFPLLVVPTYPGDEELMSSALFRELMRGMPHMRSSLDDIMKR